MGRAGSGESGSDFFLCLLKKWGEQVLGNPGLIPPCVTLKMEREGFGEFRSDSSLFHLKNGESGF